MFVATARPLTHASDADGSGCRPVHRTRMQAVPDETPVEQRGCTPVRQHRGGQSAGRVPRWGVIKAGGPTRAFSGRRVAPSKIGAFLTAGIGSKAFPIYRGAAAEAQAVRRLECSTLKK